MAVVWQWTFQNKESPSFFLSIVPFLKTCSLCRYHDTIERYCNETDTWEIVAEMPTSRSSLSCVSLLLRKDIHMSSCPESPNDNWLQMFSKWETPHCWLCAPSLGDDAKGRRPQGEAPGSSAWSVWAEHRSASWVPTSWRVQKTTAYRKRFLLNVVVKEMLRLNRRQLMSKVFMSEHYKSVKNPPAGLVCLCKVAMCYIYWAVISCYAEENWCPLQRVCVYKDLNLTCGKEATSTSDYFFVFWVFNVRLSYH